MTRVLLVDHHDSFAFLLADQFAKHGAEVRCVRPPATGGGLAACVAAFGPALVVLSPGPGHPAEATATVEWLQQLPGVPVFGVCLGLQAMIVACGGEVAAAPAPVHGRASAIDANDDPLFRGLAGPLVVARYHSLTATRVPAEFDVIATARHAGRDLVMAVRHRELPWTGVQFHPESVLSPQGGELCGRVLQAASVAAPEPTLTNPTN
ncbi:MAG: aminodeoxychorismate/anthranilate synthase component II [bacterium]|nr:aminodeoxychorismate/anthranilate synthase component II [bacterium]